MPADPFDFQQPARLNSGDVDQLAVWMRASCVSFDVVIKTLVAFDLRTSVSAIEIARWSDVSTTLDPSSLGLRVAVGSESRGALLVMQRPFAKLLAASLLGDCPTALPTDSELTPASKSVLEFLIESFLQALRDNWLGREPIDLRLGPAEPSLDRQRVVRADETVVVVRCRFTGPFGGQTWLWVLPADLVRGLLTCITKSESLAPSQSERRLLENLIDEMPARVTVKLGTIGLNARQIKALRPGDVLVLEQRTAAPVTVTVDDEATFLGWPGRVGTRQALQIESLVKG